MFIIYLLIGILFIYLQVLVMPSLAIMEVIPNILVSYVIVVSLKTELNKAAILAFFLGLGYDLFYPHLLGFNSIVLIGIVFLISLNHEKINKSRFSIVLSMLLLINSIYILTYGLYQYIGFDFSYNVFIALLIGVFYNWILSIIIVYLAEFISRIRIGLQF